MQLTKESRAGTARTFGEKEGNTGATEVQIALLTERINHISGHLGTAKKDHNSSRSLLKMVGQRKRLLKYLHDNNLTSYRSLIEKLNLRK